MFDPDVLADAVTAISGLIAPYTAVIGVGAVIALAGLLLKRLAKAGRQMSGSVLADHITQIGNALSQYAIAIAVGAITSAGVRLLRYLAKANQ